MGQPITNADGKTRFVRLVSVFAQTRGIAIDFAVLTTTGDSELKGVQYLLEQLKLKEAVLSLDAFHAKKYSCSCLRRAITIWLPSKLIKRRCIANWKSIVTLGKRASHR